MVLFFLKFAIGITMCLCLANGDPCGNSTCNSFYGRCISYPNQTYECRCDHYWTGDDCTISPCDRMECFNGGTCNNYADVYPYQCLCPSEWTGSLCQIRADPTSSSQTNRGKAFIFAFPENYKKRNGPKLAVMSTTSNDTIVHVTIIGLNFTKSLKLEPLGADHIQLPVSATTRDTNLHANTVLVEASDDIVVYGFGDNHVASNDGFLALPVPALGTEYRIVGAMARPRDLYRSQFIISGTEDNTTVNIYHREELIYGGQINSPQHELLLTLNRLESAQFQSSADLTGTWVRSNKPISVLSGSRCGFIKTDNLARKSCELMMMHLTPVDTWGREFTVSPLLRRRGSETVVRILSNTIDNHVVRSDQGRGMYMYFPYYPEDFLFTGHQPITITASQPIMVVLYSSYTSTTCINLGQKCRGDGYFGQTMTYIPPMGRYYDIAYFVTEGLLPGYTYYLNVLTKCTNKNMLYLNDYLLGESSNWLTAYEMCHLNLEISFRKFKLWSAQPNATFIAHMASVRRGAVFSVPVGAKLGSANALKGDAKTSYTTGKDFVFAFMASGNSYVLDKGPKVIMIADKDAVTDTHVSIKTHDTTTDVVIPPGESRTIELSGRVIAIDGYVPRPPAAIHITSSLPTTVYGLNDAYPFMDDPRSDVFRALPTNSLGTEYYLISCHTGSSYSGKRAQFILIGIYDHTQVLLVLRGPLSFEGAVHYGGSTMRVTVNRLQALYFTSNDHQIGTHVVATKPVSVLSGCDCGTSFEASPCEHQIEHLVPVQSWGRHFVIPRFFGYEGGDTHMTILTSQDRTKLDIQEGYWMRGGKFYFTNGANNFSSSSFEANRPVMVAAVIDHAELTDCQPPCSPNGYSTPAMTLIPPLTPVNGNVAFTHLDIRNANYTYNYVAIVFSCRDSEELVLNDETLAVWGIEEHVTGKEHCITTVALKRNTTYFLSAKQSGIAVSAIAYGFSGDASFAYPLL